MPPDDLATVTLAAFCGALGLAIAAGSLAFVRVLRWRRDLRRRPWSFDLAWPLTLGLAAGLVLWSDRRQQLDDLLVPPDARRYVAEIRDGHLHVAHPDASPAVRDEFWAEVSVPVELSVTNATAATARVAIAAMRVEHTVAAGGSPTIWFVPTLSGDQRVAVTGLDGADLTVAATLHVVERETFERQPWRR